MTKLSKALLLVAALAILAIAVLASDDSAPPPPSYDDEVASEAIGSSSEVATADATASTGDRIELDADFAPPAVPQTDRSDVAPEDEAIPSEGPLVRVVRRLDQGKQEPAPGVEVAWILLDEGNRRAASVPSTELRPRESEWPERFGQRARTGSDGTLRLPPVLADTCVAAGEASMFAYQRIGRRHKELTLVLEADETATVLVVDEQDRRRSGVPLALAWTAEGEQPNAFWRGNTDARGEAIVRHFQLVRPAHKDGERFVALLSVPLLEPSFLEFQGRPVPSEPLRLVLPSTRALDLTIHHHRGAPLLMPIGVMLVYERRPDPKWSTLLPRGFDRLRSEKPLGLEPAQFAHLGVGTSVRAFVRLPGEERPRDLGLVQISGDDQSRIAMPLRLPDDVRVIALRAVRDDGTPLALADLPWQLQLPRFPGQSGNLKTLENGAADFIVPIEGNQNAPLSADPLTLLLRETIDPETVLMASVPLGVLVRGERRDLGDVALAPAPLLVRGRVVDDLGEPRPNTRVQVELALQTDQGERWSPAPHQQKQTADDGSFAFFAKAPPQQFRLVAPNGGEHFTGQTGPLSPGAEVVLVQPRAGILQGRVIPPQGTPENSITLVLARDDEGADRPRRNRNQSTPIRRRNGYFWLGNLQPGSYTATVTMRGLQAPLATFSALRIDPGTNEDARLSPLDLSLALYRYRLRALSQNGQPLAAVDGPILWRHQAVGQDAPQFTAFRWQDGKADFFLPVAFADFVLVGQGFAATTVALAAGERDVVLQPISPFPIELPGVRSLAGPTRSIRVSAVSTAATGLPEGIGGQDQQKGEGFSFSRWHLGKSGGGWLDSADRTGLVVSRSGPHELTLRIYEGEDRQGRQAAIPLGTHELLVDGSALRPLSLAVDFAQLQAALQSLQPRQEQNGGAPPNGRRNETRRR